jgi:hypothetical protein
MLAEIPVQWRAPGTGSLATAATPVMALLKPWATIDGGARIDLRDPDAVRVRGHSSLGFASVPPWPPEPTVLHGIRRRLAESGHSSTGSDGVSDDRLRWSPLRVSLWIVGFGALAFVPFLVSCCVLVMAFVAQLLALRRKIRQALGVPVDDWYDHRSQPVLVLSAPIPSGACCTTGRHAPFSSS